MIVKHRDNFTSLPFFRIQRRVVRLKSTDVSEEYIASIFRIEEIICFHAAFLLGLFFGSEDEGDMFLRNVN
jgi:hypothetical protein